MKIETWNTGRQYGPHGQRIAARYDLDTDSILFADVDREIHGRIPVDGRWDRETSMRQFVMSGYDNGNYYSTTTQHDLVAAAKAENATGSFKIKLTITLDEIFLSDVLVTAAEGGINYWSRIFNAKHRVLPDLNNEYDSPALVAFDVEDREDPTHGERQTVTTETIGYAIQAVLDGKTTVSPSIRQDIYRAVMAGEAGDIDACDADCLVQIGLFGQVVYG